MKWLLLALALLILTVNPALAAYDVVVVSKGTVAAATQTWPVLTSIAFNGTTFTTTQSSTKTYVPAYQVIGGVVAWGFSNGAWTYLAGQTAVDRYTGAAYAQLLDIWGSNYTYDPALGPPAYQFPNGLADILNPPKDVPLDVSKAISFLLGGLTGFGFVMASSVRW